jgi:hypothetical protein
MVHNDISVISSKPFCTVLENALVLNGSTLEFCERRKKMDTVFGT